MQTSEQTAELVKALVAARGKFKPVVRDTAGQVGQNRTYKYADLATVIDATDEALAAHGLVLVQAVNAESLVTRLCHESGQWIESAYPLHRSDRPQEFGSQLTYARRYSMLALLGVAQEDDDGASASKPAPTQTPSSRTTTPTPTPSRLPAEGVWDGIVTTTEKWKEGRKKDGTPWTIWKVLGANDHGSAWFTTFSSSVEKAAREIKGEVRITYKTSDKGTLNIEGIEPAPRAALPDEYEDDIPF